MCPIFENFPYTNYHDLNLDWVLEQVNQIPDKLSSKQDEITANAATAAAKIAAPQAAQLAIPTATEEATNAATQAASVAATAAATEAATQNAIKALRPELKPDEYPHTIEVSEWVLNASTQLYTAQIPVPNVEDTDRIMVGLGAVTQAEYQSAAKAGLSATALTFPGKPAATVSIACMQGIKPTIPIPVIAFVW